jgi:hypothetical protein
MPFTPDGFLGAQLHCEIRSLHIKQIEFFVFAIEVLLPTIESADWSGFSTKHRE